MYGCMGVWCKRVACWVYGVRECIFGCMGVWYTGVCTGYMSMYTRPRVSAYVSVYMSVCVCVCVCVVYVLCTLVCMRYGC